MNSITLKQLRYVESLARHQHFGHAAEACAISQPALSMQIRDLENGLGTKLFDRSGRKVALTQFGEVFLVRAKDILRAVDDLDDLARASRGGLSGRLRLGVIPTIAPYLLPRMIACLTQAYPGVDLRIRETMTANLLEDLSQGRIDAAIVALPVSEASIEEVMLFSEPFVLVRPQSDAGKAVPAPEALARMRLLLLEEGHCFRDQALSYCSMPTARPRDGLDGTSLSTLVQMVGAGLGVTLLPQMAVPVETASANVSVTAFQAPGPQRQIGMIWRKTSPLSGQLSTIAEVLKKLSQTL